MARYCNRNFLSSDAKDSEQYAAGTTHYYPLPSLGGSTDFGSMQTSQTYLIGKLATFTDESGRTIRQAVLTQNRGVITVPNQATLTSMGLQKAAYGNNLNLLPDGVEVKHSIINQQYYALLMPEAVRYSAGILDYFFRGRLDVSLTWDGVAQNFNLHITNRSGQDLRGGSFLLFGEDASGNRSPVTLTPSPRQATILPTG